MSRKGPTISGGKTEFTDVAAAHKWLSSGQALLSNGSRAVKYDDLVKVMAKHTNPMSSIMDRQVSPESFDDWETFRTFYSRQSSGVLFVNSKTDWTHPTKMLTTMSSDTVPK